MWRGYIFIRSFWTGVLLKKLSFETTDSSHQVIIDISKGSKIKPNLTEWELGKIFSIEKEGQR